MLPIGWVIDRGPEFDVRGVHISPPPVDLSAITGEQRPNGSGIGGSRGQLPVLVVQDEILFNFKIQGRKVNPKTTHQKPELLLDIPNFNHEKPRLESSLKTQCNGFSSPKFLVNFDPNIYG